LEPSGFHDKTTGVAVQAQGVGGHRRKRGLKMGRGGVPDRMVIGPGEVRLQERSRQRTAPRGKTASFVCSQGIYRGQPREGKKDSYQKSCVVNSHPWRQSNDQAHERRLPERVADTSLE